MSLNSKPNSYQEVIGEALRRKGSIVDLRHAFRPTLSLAGMADGEEDEGGEEDDDDDDEDEEEDPDESKDLKDPEKKRLSEEAKKYRLRMKEQRRRAEEAERKLAEKDNEGKPELEQITAERDELKSTVERLQEQLTSQALTMSVRDGLEKYGLRTDRLKQIMREIDMDEIEIEDGQVVSGLDDELKRVAKDFTEWRVSKSDSTEDDEDDDTGGSQRQPSGRTVNPKRRKDESYDRKALEGKFPALARRIH